MLLISQFEELISKNTGKNCIIQRNYSERISKDMLKANISKLSAYTPNILSCSHIDGSVLIALFFDSSSPASSS